MRTRLDIDRTVRSGKRSQDRLLRIYLRANGFSHARLGVTVSKKVSARAHDRNRIKRQIRECFRKHQAMLAGFDVVVVAMTAAARAGNIEIRDELERHWIANLD